jgi:hypothetical protein
MSKKLTVTERDDSLEIKSLDAREVGLTQRGMAYNKA